MLTQVNFKVFTVTMMEGIIDHARAKLTDVHMIDRNVIGLSVQKRPRKSTAGWKLQILWKDK
eukprot:1259341-Ditylum_brightwellii.AAC.1